ncbi:MAG TPA: hypothetical protein VGH28_08480 [Polyangiaceae bacterium]|jgi:hypothetical protein
MKVAWLAMLTACSALDPEIGDLSPPIDAGPPVLFGRDIRPLMDRSSSDPSGHGCKACHYAKFTSHVGTDASGLDLSTLGALRRGGNDTHQNIVVPYSPEGSALVQKLRGTFSIGVRMPKDGPPYWSEDEIELVERWILQGAKGDDSE